MFDVLRIIIGKGRTAHVERPQLLHAAEMLEQWWLNSRRYRADVER